MGQTFLLKGRVVFSHLVNIDLVHNYGPISIVCKQATGEDCLGTMVKQMKDSVVNYV